MGQHQESFDKGLWNAEDPGLLDAGQMPYIRNGVYRSGKQALQRIEGRTAFGSASGAATGVPGLRDVQFDNGDHYLIAQVGSKYRYATVGATGAFSDLAAVTTGTQLDRVHYRNRFFLLNGATLTATGNPNSNLVVYLSATAAGTAPSVRQHGMNPVAASPANLTASGTFSQTVTGYYEYWTTEVAKLSADGAEFAMESTFVGKPVTIYVSSTAMVPKIEMPSPLANAITTHWRVYRSPKKDKESDKKFPTGYLISDMTVASSTAMNSFVLDTQTTASASSFPANFNSGGDFFAAWSSAASLSADDGTYASATVPATLGALKSQGVYGFNFGGFTGTIKGITVECQAYVSATGSAGLSVSIGKNRTSAGGWPGDLPAGGNVSQILGIGSVLNQLGAGNVYNVATKGSVVTATASPGQTVTLGSSTDPWFQSGGLVDSDFGTRFMAVLNTGKLSGAPTVFVDYVKVTVTYAATFDSVVPFPTVVYTFGDIAAQVGKNGPPPSSSTGDLYEDCLVVNDVSNPSMIRWSYPGDPEAFPATYFLDVETADNDIVRCIKVVNSRCCVWLDGSCYRMNYLPSERDASFDRGKAVEVISGQYGAVSPTCVALFSTDQGRERAAFVSHKGIFATDGYSLEEFTGGLDWRTIISTTATSTPICLVNDPEKQVLTFFYRNDTDATETYLALELCYASDHLIDGRPKVSGPYVTRNYNSAAGGTYASLDSAWVVPRSSGSHSLYLGYGGTATAAGAGQVYIESGTTLPTDNPTMRWKTRELYLAGHGNEWRADQLHFYVGGNSGAVTASAQAYSRKTNDDTGMVAGFGNSVTVSGRRFARMQMRQAGEAIQFYVTASGQQSQAHHFMLIDGEDFGLEDSGK